MNFCYSDESGMGEDQIAVMVGILVDSGRMHRTKDDWRELLDLLREETGRNLTELHTADFYKGSGIWRGLAPEKRTAVITDVFNWFQQRKHHIIYSAVQKSSYLEALRGGLIPEEVNTLWRFLAFHITLAVQRCSQPEPKNKGHTLMVFDNEEHEKKRFTEVLQNPPEWSEEYYGIKKKARPLDQIVDGVPYFHDSKAVPLLQVADFMAYFLRRYAEITDGLVPARYDEEEFRINDWIASGRLRSIGTPHMYSRARRNSAQELFWAHAPQSIKELHQD